MELSASHRKPRGHLLDYFQSTPPLRAGHSEDGGCSCHGAVSYYGGMRTITMDEREACGCECCGAPHSPVPLDCMGVPSSRRLKQTLQNTVIPPMQSRLDQRNPFSLPQRVLDLGCLGFYGHPSWYYDCTAYQGPCSRSEETGVRNLERQITPLPTALFLHIAVFLSAEDVAALASVCRSLRWVAFNRDIWRSLCFSERYAACTSVPVVPHYRSVGTNRRGAGPMKGLLEQAPSLPVLDEGTLEKLDVNSSTGRKRILQQNSICGEGCRNHEANVAGGPMCKWHDESDTSLGWRCHLKPAYPHQSGTEAYWKGVTNCRGLQALPGYKVDELVDWRFLFLLNRVSPGPRIYVRVRELELSFPLHPVVPDVDNTRALSSGVVCHGSEGTDYAIGEHEKTCLSKWNAHAKRLSPQLFVSTFIQRAINIAQPMRLRHVRPGGRPGLCVAEILRDQHYLLEWQVPLCCLLKPSSYSSSDPLPSIITAGESDLVWPLPPYGGTLQESFLVQIDRHCWREQRRTIYSVAEDEQTGQVLPVETTSEDQLLYDVLGLGSAFVTLLSPRSYGASAVAIVVGAVLVAVATASATAALTTAAAATATLAARRSRIFGVDLHVIERDEHEEDDQEACDGPTPTRMVSSFAGAVAVSSSGYAGSVQMATDAMASQTAQPMSLVNSLMSGTASHPFVPLLPYLQRLLPSRVNQILRSSTLASIALTEASLAFATSVFTNLSRDAMTTASAAVAAAGAAFAAVLPPPGAALGTQAGDSGQQTSPILWLCEETQRQRFVRGDLAFTRSAGVQLNEDLEGKGTKQEQDVLCVAPTQEQLVTDHKHGVSDESALVHSSLQVPSKQRWFHSFFSACIGRLDPFQRKERCSLRVRAESVVPRLHATCSSTGTLLPLPPQRRTPTRSETARRSEVLALGCKEAEGPCDSSVSQEDGERSSSSPVSTSNMEQSSSSSAFERQPESPPLQLPVHGLLLFVRTYLPHAKGLNCFNERVKFCSAGAEWDWCTAIPEDVPLLLPTDATASDLVLLLFLTLTHRNYMLPLVTRYPPIGSRVSSLDGSSLCRRSKDKDTSSARLALLRFWLASTNRSEENREEQPLPSAKLTADLRFMSCERLSLAVLPFAMAMWHEPACARCLTVACRPRNPLLQRSGRAQRKYACRRTTGAQRSVQESHSSKKKASTGVLSSISKQDGAPIAVVMDTPREGEPILVLRRESSSAPFGGRTEWMVRDSAQDTLRNSCLPPTVSQPMHRACDVVMHATDGLKEVLPLERALQDTSESAHYNFGEQSRGSIVGHTNGAQDNCASSTPCMYLEASTEGRCSSISWAEGILGDVDTTNCCKPWILQSSVNSRQFEYHPQRSNVMLTGRNDGTVRVLDWERDVILGTELVDSHQILGLSWLKHHPELFVCAAGVSGIPYVVRWREHEDDSTSDQGDRGRVPLRATASPPHGYPFLTRPSALHQLPSEMSHGNASRQDQQYLQNRDDRMDSSTVTAALTWFRRYGRGERVTREGSASLRIVHQYCACEDLSSVSVNSTDDYLLVSGRSADLTIHDVATGARLGALSGLHSGSINIVRFAHTSPYLFVTASFDQTCRLWDLRQRISGHRPLLTVDTGSLSVMCCFDDADEWLLCSGVDAALRQVCLRSCTVSPESFRIPPVNAETNFRRAVYLMGGKEFITAGTEEGFFRVFSRQGRDLGVVSLEGLLRPFTRNPSSAILPDMQSDLLNLRIYLRSHVALGISAMGDAAIATAAGVTRSSLAAVLRSALRHLGAPPTGLIDREIVLDRMRQVMGDLGIAGFSCIPQGGLLRSAQQLLPEVGAGMQENSVVEEYVQSLRAHPQERRLVGALLAAKDRVETASKEASFVAMSRLPATMLE